MTVSKMNKSICKQYAIFSIVPKSNVGLVGVRWGDIYVKWYEHHWLKSFVF